MRVLKRDNGTCKHCGSTKNPTVWHLFPVHAYPHLAGDINYCITLCEKCQTKANKEYTVQPFCLID